MAAVPPTRPRRTESLLELSGCGPSPPALEVALKYADRARAVSADRASVKLKRLPRLRKLELMSGPPAWIGELRQLRTLICGGEFSKLPAGLFTLPRLRFLHLDGSNLARLDGIERLKALTSVTVSGTPLGDDPERLAAVVGGIAGAELDDAIAGVTFRRTPAKPPRSKRALARALREDALDDESDLRGVDLRGERFEDCYVSHDLREAKLANTTWIRCDFEWAKLAGADLSGATFHDCYFGDVSGEAGNLEKVVAPGATFVGCGGGLVLTGADLRGARFLDMDPDVSLGLEKVKGQGLELEASFASEKEHQISAKGADLRGARARFDVIEERRAEIAEKERSRFVWTQDHLKGAKTDATTVISYAPLVGPARPQPATTVDPDGPAAEMLTQIHATNAALWLIVADAADAAAWRGSEDDEDGDDFERALAAEDGPIAVGAAKGVRVEIGDRSGWSGVWRIDGGVALLDVSWQLRDRSERAQAAGLRMAQWPITRKPRRIGRVTVRSGALALLLPYCPGAFTAKQLAQARAGAVITDPDSARVLLPLPNGTYTVARHPFAPVRAQGNYEDEAGTYGDCVRITLE